MSETNSGMTNPVETLVRVPWPEDKLPCPFCGSDDIVMVQDEELHWCCCTLCGVEGPVRPSRIHPEY